MFSASLKVGRRTTARTRGDANPRSASTGAPTATILIVMAQVASLRIVGDVADRLLASDLPDLPTERRSEVVRFVARRVDTMPGLTRLGVLTIGVVLRTLLAAPRGWTLVRGVMSVPLPLVGEFPRLVRSLGFAYVWETWPGTTPTGGPA